MTTRITYSFASSPSAALAKAFAHAEDVIEAVCDVDLARVDAGADISIVQSDVWGPGAATIGLPSTVWVDPELEDSWGFGPGTYGGLVVTHEFLHSLGLGHRYDLSMHDSIMSATYVYAPDGTVLNPEAPMPADIAALTAIYGANPDTAGDRTWHRVTDPSGLYTVADAGGQGDVLDLSSILAPALVDLQSGYVTYDAGYVHTAGIEAVKLGRGADLVVLHPGDIVYGPGWDDTLIAAYGEIDRMSRREKRDEGLSRGKWCEVDGAYVQGSYKLVDAIVVEA